MLLVNVLIIIFLLLILLHCISNHTKENFTSNEARKKYYKQMHNKWKNIYEKYLLLNENMDEYTSKEYTQRFEDAKNKDVNQISGHVDNTTDTVSNTSIKN